MLRRLSRNMRSLEEKGQWKWNELAWWGGKLCQPRGTRVNPGSCPLLRQVNATPVASCLAPVNLGSLTFFQAFFWFEKSLSVRTHLLCSSVLPACQRTYCSQCALIDWYVECGNIASETDTTLSAARAARQKLTSRLPLDTQFRISDPVGSNMRTSRCKNEKWHRV